MTQWQRRARIFWHRYIAPGAFEREPHFRAMLRKTAHDGLRVTGLLVSVAVVLYVLYRVIEGELPVWSEPARAGAVATIPLWDKVLILTLSVMLAVFGRLHVGLRMARGAMALYLLTVAWFVVLQSFEPGNYNLSAAWLTLLLIVGVGTVPLKSWHVVVLGLAMMAEYWYFALFTPGMTGDVPRLVFLILVTVVISLLATLLYASRFRQYRSNRRIGILKDYASARSAMLETLLKRERGMQEQLVQQEKLASLGELTAGIAHEIKNPLNFITNFAQLAHDLAKEVRDALDAHLDDPVRVLDEEVRDALEDLLLNTERIVEHGWRADSIVKSMLAHSRTSPGDLEPVDFNNLVGEYAGLAYHGMRARHRFDVEVQRDFDQTMPPIPVVREEIGRVFLNLFSNAFDALRARAEQAAADGEAFAPRIRVETQSTPAGALVRITDNATGMPKDVAAHVFEPFFTTKPTGQGTGLGLSLAYEIVTKGHNGTMTVETEEGQGTSFILTLPVEPAVENEEAPVPEPMAMP